MSDFDRDMELRRSIWRIAILSLIALVALVLVVVVSAFFAFTRSATGRKSS